MAEFNIVHLSDLHIQGNALSPTLVKLVEDVKRKTEGMKSIVLVITGDIVHRGKYRENPDKSYGLNRTAIDFFERLNLALNTDFVTGATRNWKSKRVIDVQIVAGNHDKDMSGLTVGENIYEDFAGTEKEWNDIKPCFDDFIRFANAVYDIFEIKKTVEKKVRNGHYSCNLSPNSKEITDSFGIEFVDVTCLTELTDLASGKDTDEDPNSCCIRCKEIELNDAIPELTVVFVRLNTAVVSFGGTEEKEHHNLSLGKHQLESVIAKYRAGREQLHKNDIVTIVLAHHPTSFLKPLEEDKFRDALLDEERLIADFYICGHTHTRSFTNLSKNDLKVTTLVTGIGWEHGPGDDKSTHSYSIYSFSEAKNNMATRMFRTDTNGQFKDDHQYYTPRQSEIGMIPSPFRILEHPTIKLSRTGNVINELFVDDSTLTDITKLYDSKSNFAKQVGNLIRSILLLSCIEFIEKSEKNESEFAATLLKQIKEYAIVGNDAKYSNFFFSSAIDNLLKLTIRSITHVVTDYANEKFDFFLSELSSIFVSSFKENFLHDIVRFRVCRHGHICEGEAKLDCYVPFAESPMSRNTTNRIYHWNKGIGKGHAITRSAYEDKRPKIYTLNKELVEFKVENWLDFIVFAPHTLRFQPNDQSGSNEEFPALVFVVSVKLDNQEIRGKGFKEVKRMFKNLSNKLFLMDYINITDVLKEAVNNFQKFYKIEPEQFISYLENKP